jgi:hypothetical protein
MFVGASLDLRCSAKAVGGFRKTVPSFARKSGGGVG